MKKLIIILVVLLTICLASPTLGSGIDGYLTHVTIQRTTDDTLLWIERTGVSDSLLWIARWAIPVSPVSYDFGTVVESGIYATGVDYFTVTNYGEGAIDIALSVGNMTGGTQWTPSDTATPGNKIFGLKAGLSGSGGWTSPTGYDDPGSEWVDETNAYDESTGSYSYSDIPGKSWSNYLELTLPEAIDCSKIQYYFEKESANIDDWEIDVYYSSGWNNIHTGDAVYETWTEVNIGSTESVSATRIKAYNSHNSQSRMAYVCEFDFWELSTYSIIVKSSSPNNLVTNMAGSTTQDWGLQFYAPTDWDDEVEKEAAVTLTVSLS